MLVSIVIPSYQQARFLRAAVDSVLLQDHEPIEVLVLDGGSSDGSVDILREYGDRLWFRSERDGGQCHAINEGFRRAKGEVVAWLNSDDFYYPGAIHRAVDALAAAPDAGLVYGEGNLVDEAGDVLWRFPETVPFDLWRLANVADYILQPTVFFRRDALFECGLLDEQLQWGLDWDLWLRMGRRTSFAYVPEILAAGRIHLETKTATGGLRRLREIFRILRRHGVRGPSPAAVAHTVTTVVRKVRPTQDPVATDAVVAGVPRGLRGLARPFVAGTERRLRRWLQNAQGLWRDGYVGGVGHLWLPSGGASVRLRVRGRNLELDRQVVRLRCGKHRAATRALGPGEPFELDVEVDRGSSPVKARLSCARLQRVSPLDPALGDRRAGCVLDEWDLE